jgi:hypothetical protein
MAAPKSKRWSQRVTETSDALDLERDVFTKGDPRAIARSLKTSAERSRRRKSDPYRSAMSMLTFYINRAGKNLPKQRRNRLEAAKDELRKLYKKAPSRKPAKKSTKKT